MAGRRHRRVRLHGLVATSLLVAVACGGGGGGGTPTQPTPGISFSADAPPSSPSLHLAAGAGGGLVLELRAQDVVDLYGVGFDLTFPASLVAYTSASEGPFLARDGGETSFQVAEGGPGRLVVGLTRLGALPGVSGSGVLLTLRFASAGGGSGALGFAGEQAFDSLGRVLDEVAWIGGRVEVVP